MKSTIYHLDNLLKRQAWNMYTPMTFLEQKMQGQALDDTFPLSTSTSTMSVSIV